MEAYHPEQISFLDNTPSHSPKHKNKDNIIYFPGSEPHAAHPIESHATQPITDPEVLASIKSKLLTSSKKYGLRNYWIFQLGINIGLRCGDLLSIRIQDVFDESTQTVKNPFYIKEQKTDKVQMIGLNPHLREELKEYILTLKNRNFFSPLFPSQKTQPKKISSKDNSLNTTGCLTPKSYHKIISSIGKDLGIEHMGTHVMRKTCLRAIYDQNKHTLTPEGFSALDIVQMIANHSSSNTTLRYLGITDEVKLNARMNLNL